MKNLFNNKGLTLVEVIITLSILGIVIVPLMSMFITSQKINNESDMKYQAIQLAQEHMEKIKAINPLMVSTDYDDDGNPTSDGDFFKTITNSDGYKLNIKIEKNDGITPTDVSMIQVPEESEFNIKLELNDTNLHEINVSASEIKIKVQLNINDGKIKINNEYSGVKVYIFKTDSTYNYTISGNATVIEVPDSMSKPDNILYDIIIDVNKGSKFIDTIKGTTVFEKQPQ